MAAALALPMALAILWVPAEVAGRCLPKFGGACAGNFLTFQGFAESEVSQIVELREARYSFAPYPVDVDGDGDLDMVVGTNMDMLISERLPNGSLAAFRAWTSPMGHTWLRPQMVDWDGDGDIDLILGAYDGVYYYENRAGGLVYNSTLYQEAFCFCRPQVADWEGDGDLDLLVVRTVGMSYFERLSDGNLHTPSHNPFLGVPHSLLGGAQLVDFDRDGDLDLILMQGEDSLHLVYYERTATGSLLRRTGEVADPFHGLGTFGSTPLEQPVVVDWDGDGELELLVGGVTRIDHFKYARAANLVPRVGAVANPFYSIAIDPTPFFFRVKVVDWDRDGDYDVLSVNVSGHMAYHERVEGGWAPARAMVGDWPVIRSLEAVDWDADGDVDLLLGYATFVSGRLVEGLAYYERLQDGRLQRRADIFELGLLENDNYAANHHAHVVDWDADGDLDLLVRFVHDSHNTSSSIAYFERLDDQNLLRHEGAHDNPFHGLVLPTPTISFHAVDWDNDGDLDLAIGGDPPTIVEQLQDGSLVLRSGHPLGVLLQASEVDFVDWDHDGDLDLVLAPQSGQLQFYEHSGCTTADACSNNGLCNTISSQCVCFEGFTGSCAQCAAGFREWYTLNRTQCTECPAGTSSSSVGSLACSACGRGRFALNGSAECAICPPGTAPSADQASCQACPSGMSALLGVCQACPRGQVPDASAAACRPCQAGKYVEAGLSTCLDCSAPFVPADDAASCELSKPVMVLFVLIPVLLLGSALAYCLWWWRGRRLQRTMQMAVKTRDAKRLAVAVRQARWFRVDRQVLQDAQNAIRMCENKYVDMEYLLQVIQEGDLALVKGSWLAKAQNVQRFKRRQDLPKEALWEASELQSEQRTTLFVAVSYCWLHPVHPDPKSEHLKTLSQALRLRLQVRGPGSVTDIALFLDFCSLAQHGEAGNPLQPEAGVERSSVEKVSFGKGLKQVNLLYAHQQVEVWKMMWVPEEEPRKYSTRGWPVFEQSVAGIIKDTTKLLSLEPALEGCASWLDIADPAAHGRTPPETPDNFNEIIKTKRFTNGKNGEDDMKFVMDKYQETFSEVVSKARTLWFSQLDWEDVQAEKLADLLKHCGNLEQLFLSSNRFTAAGALVLTRAVRTCPTLRVMDLRGNPIEPQSTAAIKDSWAEAGRPHDGLRLGGSQAQVPLLGDACFDV